MNVLSAPYHGGWLESYAHSFLLVMALMLVSRILKCYSANRFLNWASACAFDVSLIGGILIGMQAALDKSFFSGKPRLVMVTYNLVGCLLATVCLGWYVFKALKMCAHQDKSTTIEADASVRR